MRATPIAVTTLAAALLLTACASGGEESGKNQESTACRIGQVGMEVGPANVAPAAGDTGNVPVSLTNQSAPCTLDGFPGVVLQADGASAAVPAEKGARAQKLTLVKGSSASFTLTYVRGTAGGKDGLDARTLKISLPGASAGESFRWSYGPVAGEDAPEVSVSSFRQAGD